MIVAQPAKIVDVDQTAAALWVVDEPQPSEVHLGHLSGRTRLHPNRPGVVAPVAALDEAAQRGVGHPAPTLSQQLLDAGQLQVIDGEPAVDLIGPGARRSSVGARARLGPDRPTDASRLSCSSVGTGPSWRTPAFRAATRYLRTVSLESPVPDAMCRWLLPACQRRMTSAISTRDTSL